MANGTTTTDSPTKQFNPDEFMKSRGTKPFDPDEFMASRTEQVKALPGATPRLLASPAAQGAQRSDTEKNVTGEGIPTKGAGAAAWEAVKNISGAIASQFDPSPSESTILHPSKMPIVQAFREAKSGYGRGMEDFKRGYAHPLAPLGEAVTSGIGSLFGVSGEQQAENASHGESGKIIGQTAVPAATVALSPLAEPIVRAIPKLGIGDAVGRTLREPTQKLKPLVHAGSRVAGGVVGGAAGAATGVPYAGYGGLALGGVVGPEVADALIPAHPNPIGWNVKLPGRIRVPSGTPKGSPTPFGTTEGVSVYPEPREPLPGDRPGAMWSVGREDVLPEAAKRSAPGAGDVLRNIGKPIIYTPREGIGYPGPRTSGEAVAPMQKPRVPIEEKVKTLVPPERRGMEGPPMNQLKVLSDKLERTDLTDFERNTLEAQFEDLTGRKWTPRSVKK